MSEQKQNPNEEDKQTTFERIVEELTEKRDELRLQMHLGTMEAKEQLSKLEDKYYEFRDKYGPSRESINEATEETWETIKNVGNELRNGFERIRKSFDSK